MHHRSSGARRTNVDAEPHGRPLARGLLCLGGMNSPIPNSSTNYHVIAESEVWMETAAVDQLRQVAALCGCRRAVGMPDLHPGRGIPIGAAFAFDDRVRPALVGGDAGCGARVIAVKRPRFTGDALVRRVSAETEGPALPDCDPAELFAAAWRAGPRGLLGVDGLPDSLAGVIEALVPEGRSADDTCESGSLPAPPDESGGFGEQLGTAGGGNHFVEIARVERVADKAAARALDLSPGELAVVAHSGSRHLGAVVGARWHDAVLDTPDTQAAYLADLAGCCRYAEANRLVLAWRLLVALGATRESSLGASFDLIHNTVRREAVDGRDAFVHRKGCAPAPKDAPTIVLGSRGTPSWVMLGEGCADSLSSVAHGAGRRMGRHEAVAKLRDRYPRSTLSRTPGGGTVLCDDPELLYAEHPDAYKAIEPVIDSLERAGAARRVAALLPIVNVKR
jgi:release factor H-coupled RctB family protein